MLLLYYVLQLPLPDEYVAERYYHSVSTLQLGPHCMWLILFGGFPHQADSIIIELCEYLQCIVVTDAHTDSGTGVLQT